MISFNKVRDHAPDNVRPLRPFPVRAGRAFGGATALPWRGIALSAATIFTVLFAVASALIGWRAAHEVIQAITPAWSALPLR